MKSKKIVLLYLFWIIGIISLIGFWSKQISYFYGGPPKTFKPIGKFLYNIFTIPLPQPLGIISNIFYWYLNLSFIFVFFFSFFGIFLGIKTLKTHRNYACLGIALNLINLLLSLFIFWVVFTLARGM